jgi:hypothetical protein
MLKRSALCTGESSSTKVRRLMGSDGFRRGYGPRCRDLTYQIVDHLGRHRSREVEALGKITRERSYLATLLCRLYSLADDRHIQ